MKKTLVIIDVCLFITFAFLACIFVFHLIKIINAVPALANLKDEYNYLITHPEITNEATIHLYFEEINEATKNLTFYIIFTVISLLTLSSIILVFIFVNPQIFRKGHISEIKQFFVQKQEETQAAKAQREKERKAVRISELEEELEALKKNKD